MTSIQSNTKTPLTTDNLLQTHRKENKSTLQTAERHKSTTAYPAKKKGLSLAQLNKLDSSELNKLSPAQLNKLNAKQLNKLQPQQLNKLSTQQLNKLNGAQLSKLSAAVLSKLNNNQISKLNKSQLEKLPAAKLKTLSAQILNKLSPAKRKSLGIKEAGQDQLAPSEKVSISQKAKNKLQSEKNDMDAGQARKTQEKITRPDTILTAVTIKD